ncbi:RNA-binding S4 domain-containing protein [Agrobacterium vitis]|uniref:RNA-binding S4 domain-containing protein n=1 Tax=Agrobacterium vitis TaxID=373 RepID=A0A7K1RIJ5_AGRVI|nr:RNA-binding S4 domain-containing protein [Agrobacterium vitis]MVA57833.1 RNA-binding S4 domain-containing protein [Agrobacterium vitis]
MSEQQPLAGPSQRIDKWLFFARIFKSRTLAQQNIISGRVRVNGKPAKQPSTIVRPGDVLDITLANHDMKLVVRQPGTHRGPYEQAKLLYEDQSPPRQARDALTAFEQAQRLPGSGRPTKRERRQLDRLMDGED